MGDPNKTNASQTPAGREPQPTPKPPPQPPTAPPPKHSIQAPKGTRDLYPDDANLRRYITDAWRNTSIRHGFEEIDGPTFEDANLYKVKSGEGILAEMFGVFSGKSPEDVAQVRETGEAPLALRPEFTPTLARMYAARAAQLAKPTKWFTAGPFFRAERPQRGRLREFLQWNVDFIGLPPASEVAQVSNLGSGEARSDQPDGPKVRRLSEPASLPSSTQPPAHDPLSEARARADAECIACCVGCLRSLGLTPADVQIRVSDRRLLEALLVSLGLEEARVPEVRAFLDERPKLDQARRALRDQELAFDFGSFQAKSRWLSEDFAARYRLASTPVGGERFGQGAQHVEHEFDYSEFRPVFDHAAALGIIDWIVLDPSIVRGLAYYTGMVFEVIADGERAVAGGGRYDNLIELFGGPPTPAVGFGMGDVVLANLLRDKGLLPEGAAMLDALATPPASPRPAAFVLTADASLDPIVRRLVADLRRGSTTSADTPPKGGTAVAPHSHAESPDAADPRHAYAEPQACRTREPGRTRPLHARHSYKSTRNVGKLLKDAAAQHARFAVIIENDRDATIKDMTSGRQQWCPIDAVPAWLRSATSR